MLTGVDVRLGTFEYFQICVFQHKISSACTALTVLHGVSWVQHLLVCRAVFVQSEFHRTEWLVVRALLTFDGHFAVVGTLNEAAVIVRVPVIGDDHDIKAVPN